MTRKIHKHRCRWLHQPKRRQKGMKGRFGYRAGQPRTTLFCWQTGKNLRAKECIPCLLAQSITLVAGGGLPHKQPMTSPEWDKRHSSGERG